MIYGHMTFRSKASAQAELANWPKEVFCLDCNEVEKLGADDCSFDDDFGGVTDWRVGTECGGNNYQRAECEVCGNKNDERDVLKNADGTRKRDEAGNLMYGPATKIMRTPADMEEWTSTKVICTVCLEEAKKEKAEEENA
jgi:hypothetical protein